MQRIYVSERLLRPGHRLMSVGSGFICLRHWLARRTVFEVHRRPRALLYRKPSFNKRRFHVSLFGGMCN